MKMKMEDRKPRPSCLPQPQSEPYPWLLYHHGKDYTKKIIQTVVGDKLQRRHCKIPEFHGKHVIASFRGWLLLYQIDSLNDQNNHEGNYSEHYALWNTCTYQSFNLPPLNLSRNQSIDYYVLLSDNDDGGDECRKIVTLLLFEGTMPCIFFYQLRVDDYDVATGGGLWRSIRYAKQMQDYHNNIINDYIPACWQGDYPQYLKNPVCCQGKLYALANHLGYKLVEIELNIDNDVDDGNENSLVITSLGCVMPKRTDITVGLWNILVDADGELFYIIFAFGGIDYKDIIAISVFRLNFTTWTWAKVDNIDNRVLFVCSKSQGFSLKAGKDGGGGGNRIYFTRLDEKMLYCYNMEDGSISVSCPCTSLPTPWISAIWVTPDVVNNPQGNQLTTLSQENVSSSFLESGNNNGEDCGIEETSKEEVKEETFDFFGLPPGLLGDISDKLMLSDYTNFRLVCKKFNEEAPLIRMKAKLTETTWLVVPGNKTKCDKDIWSFRDPQIISSKYLMTVPELLKDVIIRCSKDGWLLLSCSENQGTVIFFNPITKAMIPLPFFDHRHEPHVGFAFSSSPTSDECVVVVITWETCRAGIAIFASGMDHWDLNRFHNNLDFRPNFNNPVFWNGAFYFLGQRGNLGVLKFNGVGDYEWEVLDKPNSPSGSFRENFLVECGGELLSVFVGNMGNRVDVFKLSLSNSAWEKLDNLGNYVFYLSRFSSFATLAKSPELQKRIYFPRFKGESLVYYSLDTGKFHSVGSDDSFTDYVGTREQLLCSWIEPRLF